MIELLNIDCMEYLKDCPDKAFDLAICDPPYGIGINGMNMGSRKTILRDKRTWDAEKPPQKYFDELRRVSLNQVIWGGNYFNLPPGRCFLIWDKGESMYGRDFADCEQAWTSFDRSARMFKKSPVQLDRIHPTQKPVALYDWILRNYAKPGQRILDTHLGSMSSVIAAIAGGFSIVGCEIDSDYFIAGCNRVKKYLSQSDFTRGEVELKINDSTQTY